MQKKANFLKTSLILSEGFTKGTTLMKQEQDARKKTFRYQKRTSGNQHIEQMENSIVKIRGSV